MDLFIDGSIAAAFAQRLFQPVDVTPEKVTDEHWRS